jgi:hypothetical protein
VRRWLVLVVLAGLTACGDGDGSKSTAPMKGTGSNRSAVERDLERVRESDLPPDAKREIEEAAELLDESR